MSEQVFDSKPLWAFLRSNGVIKVGIVGTHLELLFSNGSTLTPSELISRLQATLPTMPKRTKLAGFRPPRRRKWSIGVDDSPSPVYFFSNEDYQLVESITKRRNEIHALGRDLQNLGNLVRHGVERIPKDLSGGKAVARSAPKRKKEVDLYEAKHAVAKQRRDLNSTMTLIELCRKYLKSHAIRGKPKYSATQLSNSVSKLVDE